jgi:hypothetical protein
MSVDLTSALRSEAVRWQIGASATGSCRWKRRPVRACTIFDHM